VRRQHLEVFPRNGSPADGKAGGFGLLRCSGYAGRAPATATQPSAGHRHTWAFPLFLDMDVNLTSPRRDQPLSRSTGLPSRRQGAALYGETGEGERGKTLCSWPDTKCNVDNAVEGFSKGDVHLVSRKFLGFSGGLQLAEAASSSARARIGLRETVSGLPG